MKILVVDDDFSSLKAARRVLSAHETFVASDGMTAVSVAARYHPDVILLDIILGRESGLDVIESLHAASPASVVVVMTACADFDIMRLAYANGADAFLPKAELASVPAVLDDLFSDRHQLGGQ